MTMQSKVSQQQVHLADHVNQHILHLDCHNANQTTSHICMYNETTVTTFSQSPSDCKESHLTSIPTCGRVDQSIIPS